VYNPGWNVQCKGTLSHFPPLKKKQHSNLPPIQCRLSEIFYNQKTLTAICSAVAGKNHCTCKLHFKVISQSVNCWFHTVAMLNCEKRELSQTSWHTQGVIIIFPKMLLLGYLRGVARIFQREAHTVSKWGYSLDCHDGIFAIYCRLFAYLQGGSFEHPWRTPLATVYTLVSGHPQAKPWQNHVLL